jgi:hypothetical protein
VKKLVKVYKVTGVQELEVEGKDDAAILERAMESAQTLFEPKEPDCRFIAITVKDTSPTGKVGLISRELKRPTEEKPGLKNPLPPER